MYTKYLLGIILSIYSVMIFGQKTDSVIHNRLPQLHKEFQLVVHIVKDSASSPLDSGRVKAALGTANHYFEPIKVSFSIKNFNIVSNFQYNVLEAVQAKELVSRNYQQNVINVYIVNKLNSGTTNLDGLTTINGFDKTNKFPSLILPLDHLNNIELTHELGHFFGLYDTYEKNLFGVEKINRAECLTTGDKICDTPADPFIYGGFTSDYMDGATCKFTYTTREPETNLFYSPDVTNVMSNYGCICSFSDEQFKKMAANYLANPVNW